MMPCAPCSLNTDNNADIRKMGVVNATIMNKDILDIEQIPSNKIDVLMCLFVFHKVHILHEGHTFHCKRVCCRINS